MPDAIRVDGNLETASFFIIQDRPENAGRIEMWVALPVDGTVHAYQRNCTHVADHSVIFDRLIRHCSVPSPIRVFFAKLRSSAKSKECEKQLVSIGAIRADQGPDEHSPKIMRLRIRRGPPVSAVWPETMSAWPRLWPRSTTSPSLSSCSQIWSGNSRKVNNRL